MQYKQTTPRENTENAKIRHWRKAIGAGYEITGVFTKTKNVKLQKHINAPSAQNFGQITVPFADRCHEYKSAKIPIVPTTFKTFRIGFASIMPVTIQIISSKQHEVEEIIILN